MKNQYYNYKQLKQGNYNKSVMQRAWQDYKVKKAHKGYEEWTFAESLHYAHRTIKALRKNG